MRIGSLLGHQEIVNGRRSRARRRLGLCRSVPARRGSLGGARSEVGQGHASSQVKRRNMSVVVYIVLTVAIFALLGLVQKLVEGL